MNKPSSVILEAVFCEPSYNILQEYRFTVKNLVVCATLIFSLVNIVVLVGLASCKLKTFGSLVLHHKKS